MVTRLSKATKDVKRFLIIFAIFVVVVIILNMIVISVKTPSTPPTTTIVGYPQPNNLFQQIPKPQLQSLPINPNSPALIAKTSVAFTAQPGVIYVYKIKMEREYLQDADNARNTATVLNFNKIETSVVNNIMYWQTPEKNRFLQYDKLLQIWNYHYAIYPTTGTKPLLTKESDYIVPGMTFMRALSLDTTNLDPTSGKAEFINITSSGKISNNSSAPNAVKVALDKKIKLIDPTDSKITTPYATVRKYNYNDGIANLIVNSDASNIKTDLLQLSYKYYTYTDGKAIYAILKPEDAFAKIQAKQGFLYRITTNTQNDYSDSPIYNVSEFKIDPTLTQLIYIEPETRSDDQAWTNYIQPFYLFEGTFSVSDQELGTCSFLVPALQDASYK